MIFQLELLVGKGISERGKGKDRSLEAGLKRSILSESSATVELSDMKTSLVGKNFSSCKLEKIESKAKPLLATSKKNEQLGQPYFFSVITLPKISQCPSDD